MLRKSPFIVPAQPVLRAHPPKGEQWLHEVKFDGYRAQLHKDGDTVTIYSKNGADFTQRFASIAQALTKLPAASAIIDCEIVACTDDGVPNFQLLHSRKFPQECLCAWCFDLLKFDGKEMRLVPLIVRKMNLGMLLRRYNNDFLRYSEPFDNPKSLLSQCDKHSLEGIVSKKKDAPYSSGRSKNWIKVKTTTWREANKDRGELFKTRQEKTSPLRFR